LRVKKSATLLRLVPISLAVVFDLASAGWAQLPAQAAIAAQERAHESVQETPSNPLGGAQPAQGRMPLPPAYPVRAKAPADVVARGRALYGINCAFCHGSDARGGEGGPNLVRSQLVLNDQNGELIAQVVQNGRPDKGMPKFDLSTAQISDIAAFIHDFPVSGTARGLGLAPKPLNILVGDPKAGEAYFNKTCASCHSVTGDLAGIGSRAPDARSLQQFWLMPVVGSGRAGQGAQAMAHKVPPVTATVTLPSGEKIEGELARIDDFFVSLALPDGSRRSFRRNGEVPQVQVQDPLKPHRELIPRYTDEDIHDLTSYLATIR
jgi:cytochrome c oxidase cbb3-type subunit 3